MRAFTVVLVACCAISACCPPDDVGVCEPGCAASVYDDMTNRYWCCLDADCQFRTLNQEPLGAPSSKCLMPAGTVVCYNGFQIVCEEDSTIRFTEASCTCEVD